MKKRSGFVSNSSTCSFVICGFKVSDEEFDYAGVYSKMTGKTMEQIDGLAQEYNSKRRYQETDVRQIVRDFCKDAVEKELRSEDKGIKVNSGEGMDGVIIGKSICRIGSDDFPDKEELDIESIIENLKVVRNKIGCDAPIKIFIGTKCC
jgi:hypothetical protein